MPRVARGKKTTENNKVSDEKIDKNEVTPKDQEIPGKLSVQDDKIDEPALNGNADSKITVKATKGAKGKKESKNETEKVEPKTKGATKKAVSKEVTSNDDKIEEQDVPQIPENKKRAAKKKIDEIPEEVPAAKKRNKKEPVSNGKGPQKVDDQVESIENNKKEAPKKRGAKETAKPDEQPKVDTSEPAKKRSKKIEEVPAVVDDKKRIVRRRNAIDEPMVESTEPEKPAAKKSRGKTAAKDEKLADEPKVDDLEPEKPVSKQTKGKAIKKADSKEKVSPKKAKGKGTDKSENTEQIADNVEPKKGKINKKGNKSDEKEDSIEAEPKSAPKKGKITKKDSTDEHKIDEEPKPSSPKQVKGRAAAKKAEKPAPAEKKFQNSIESDLSIDYSIKEKWNLKIVTWNISGLRSCVDKGCVDYFKQESPDVICLNEIKCGNEDEIPEKIKLDGYHTYWNVAKGMPGVGVLTKQFPEEVFYDLPGQFADEKRLITVEFKKYYLVCCYVVNAGRGLKTLDKRLEWNKAFDEYIKDLDKKKPVIIAGDMNVAHGEIDLANPKANHKNAGFTKEEREGFTQLLSNGFVDTFRQLHPDEKAYTFWSYMNNARAKNVGWRLDYFITSERFMEKVKDNVIRSTIKGSDHCPLVLFLDL
ncbi:hypothetical protein ACKWTF_005733 [Chironomus riparius]